jgi:hypothetical protein
MIGSNALTQPIWSYRGPVCPQCWEKFLERNLPIMECLSLPKKAKKPRRS